MSDLRGVLAVTATLAALAAPAPLVAGDWVFTVGPDLGRGSTKAAESTFLTIEYRSPTALATIWGVPLQPIWSLSGNNRGAVLATWGVHTAFSLGPVEVTPHFGVGLYQSGQGGAGRGKELLQFRSGIDAFVPINDRTAVGLGIAHVSNARITSRSANLDIVRLSLRQRF